jgi:hypothetical protein
LLRGLVERRDGDPRDPAGGETLDFLDLRFAIVLAERSAPDHRDAELLRRLLRAAVNHLPEDVAGALGDDRDGQLAVAAAAAARTAAAGSRREGEDRNH